MYQYSNLSSATVNTPAYIEWVHSSGISPEITALNVQPLKDQNEIRQKLGFKYYNHGPGWWVNNIDLRTGQKSPLGQFKPAKPFIFPGKDGKEDTEAKYLSSKLGYDAIALRTPDPDQWPEVVKNPKIPIAIIEGTKKTASALTCGIIGLALLGVEMGLTSSAKGTKKRELVPNLDIVAVPGRVFVFGFDMDMDVKAGVRGALRTLAKALIARGCTVLVAGWDSQYKGIDDLKVACGEDAVRDAIANAEPFEVWDKRWRAVENEQLAIKMLSCSYPAEVTVNDQYLDASSLPVMQPGEILAISSPMGTGKTELLKTQIAAYREKYPKAWVIGIGNRNTLLFQTSERLEIPHIQDLERQYPGHLEYALREHKGVLLCLDSLKKIPRDTIPSHTLLIFDEAEATANHGLGGGTLGDCQNEILDLKRSICKQVISTGGNIFLAEENLTDIGLNYYHELVGGIAPIRLVANEWKQSNSLKVTTTGKTGYIAQIFEEIILGNKFIVPTDSQQFGEILERMALSRGFKVFRLDSKTAEFPDCKMFQSNPNDYILHENPDLIILSPTAESGLSIDTEGYHVRAYLTSADTRRQSQLLGRVRKPLSIEIFTQKRGAISDRDAIADPKKLERQWFLSMRQTVMVSGISAELAEQTWSPDAQAEHARLEATLKGEDENSRFWARHYANFKARENVLKIGMEQNLTNYLTMKGFEVEQVSYKPNKAIGQEFKQEKEAIEAETAKKLFELPGGQTETVARSVLSSGTATYEQRLNATKSIHQARLPGADLSENFLLEACVKNKGKELKCANLFWMCQHREIAQKLDRSQVKAQLSNGPFLPWKLAHHTQNADLFQQLGLEQILYFADSGVEFQEKDPIVQQFKRVALNNGPSIQRLLQLNVKETQTGIEMLSKTVRRFSFVLSRTRKVGPAGRQDQIWELRSKLAMAHRTEICNALDRRWANDLNPISSISNKKNVSLEIDDINPTQPPKQDEWGVGDVVLFALDGSECKILRVEGDRFRVKRFGPWEDTLSFDVSGAELRAIA